MLIAAKTLATSGVELLMDKKLIEKARAEFAEKTKDFTYKSAIPEDQKPPLP